MKIQSIFSFPNEIPLLSGQPRSGALINLTGTKGNGGWGEIAPLPKWSKESLEDSLLQLNQKKDEILRIEWTAQTCSQQLEKLQLLPSLLFGLESALLSMLSPLSAHKVPVSALLMGSPQEITEQAALRHAEGYTVAKLKVSNLPHREAVRLIHELKDKFCLRIDVNRAWKTFDSLRFFSQFPLDAFDYVEEPFENPEDLALFSHPLAVDESFPENLSLQQLELLPTLKALIYKPTIQGGMTRCLPLYDWSKKRGVDLVLSSTFESDIGLANIASMAHRLSLSAAVGIGTYHYLKETVCAFPLQISQSFVDVPVQVVPKNNGVKSNATRM